MQSFSDKIFWLNIFALFISLQSAVILYSQSTILGNLFGTNNIWIVYSLGALTAILLNLFLSKFLHKFNITKLTKIVLVFAFLNMLNLFFNEEKILLFISFIVHLSISEFLFLLSSVMLEDLSENGKTGLNRGHYLSVQSLGYLLAPFTTSFFVKIFGTNSIFVFSSFFIFLSFIVLSLTLDKLPKFSTKRKSFFTAFRKIRLNADIRNIIFSQIGLYFFYAMAVVYLPFKLENLGISLSQYLGILLPISLVPFVFVPQALGYLEDKMKDEKEFIILSSIGIIVCIILFAFVNSVSIFVWAILLFIARLFASTIETSISSYFFKKISKDDTDIISIFTSAGSIVNLIFIPVFSLIVKTTDIKTLFLSVSFFLCFVLVLVSKIHDTKNYEKHKAWKNIWQKSKERSKRRATN